MTLHKLFVVCSFSIHDSHLSQYAHMSRFLHITAHIEQSVQVTVTAERWLNESCDVDRIDSIMID